MSKKFFRFVRGELNGYFLTQINNAFLKAFSDKETFLAQFIAMVFKRSDDVSKGEYPIPREMLHGIGTVAGVFPPMVAQDSLIGSIRFTQSHKVNGVEYSERGLLNRDTGTFNFMRTDNKEYTTDINTLANENRLTSFVEHGAKLLGFFPEDAKALTDEGEIDPSQLVHFQGTQEEQYAEAERYFKSVNKAYSPYYGLAYMYFAERSPIIARTTDDVFLELIKAMQWVRYNGVSIESLCRFAQVLCPNYLFIVDISWANGLPYGVVTYGIDEEWEINDKLMRSEVFKTVFAMKFKQYYLLETSIDVQRDDKGNPISVKERGK